MAVAARAAAATSSATATDQCDPATGCTCRDGLTAAIGVLFVKCSKVLWPDHYVDHYAVIPFMSAINPAPGVVPTPVTYTVKMSPELNDQVPVDVPPDT